MEDPSLQYEQMLILLGPTTNATWLVAGPLTHENLNQRPHGTDKHPIQSENIMLHTLFAGWHVSATARKGSKKHLTSITDGMRDTPHHMLLIKAKAKEDIYDVFNKIC